MNCKRLGSAVFIFLAAIIALPVRSQNPSQTNPAIRVFDYDLPKGRQLSLSMKTPTLAVSPDGTHFVYSTSEGLYLCSTDGSADRLIKGTKGLALNPFYSPDGKWIGYFSLPEGKLKKIAVSGGKPVDLCKASLFPCASWNEDNSIVYIAYGAGGATRVMRVSANGGTPETIWKTASGEVAFPQILPDGKSLLYTVMDNGRTRIEVKPLTRGGRKVLFEGLGARYLQTGFIVYRLAGNDGLFAAPFDLAKLEVTGKPIAIVNGILMSGMQYSISNSGTLVYIPTEDAPEPAGQFNLVWVSRDGKEEPISAEPNTYAFPKISPDGTRVALTVLARENRQICVWDLVRQRMIRLTAGETDNFNPLWSPDCKQIIYRSSKDGSNITVNSRAADGTGEAEKIAAIPSGGYLLSWLKEGNKLSLISFQRKYNEDFLQVSPDRQWVAYASDESGENEIYVRSFSDSSKGARQVSVRGGHSPLWSPDGRELFYRDAYSVIAVPVETGPVFKAGKPKALFGKTYVSLTAGRTALPMWDISPDGERFLMMKAPQPAEQPPTATGPRKIRIVLNYLEALKQRPAEK